MSVPFLLLVGLIIFARCKWANVSIGDMFIGCLLGLALAGTVIGPPILNGTQTLATAFFNGVAGAVTGLGS